MRQHASVLMLAARGSLYKVLVLLAAMAGAETGLFLLGLKRLTAEAARSAEAAAAAELAGDPGAWESLIAWPSLERLFTGNGIQLVFSVGLIVLVLLLTLDGGLSARRANDTLRRLSVSQRAITLWNAVYNLAVILIFWAAQLITALALCRVYLGQADPSAVNGQTVLLAFYRQGFLHGLLPMADVDRWVYQIALTAGLAITAACGACRLRHGRAAVAPGMAAALGALTFHHGLTALEVNWMVAAAVAIITAAALYNLKGVRDGEA